MTIHNIIADANEIISWLDALCSDIGQCRTRGDFRPGNEVRGFEQLNTGLQGGANFLDTLSQNLRNCSLGGHNARNCSMMSGIKALPESILSQTHVVIGEIDALAHRVSTFARVEGMNLDRPKSDIERATCELIRGLLSLARCLEAVNRQLRETLVLA